MNADAPLVVVVEDDVDVARTIRDLLVAEGYRVAVAGGGESALFDCAIEDPAVVLLDLRLPKMGGAEFLQLYRAGRYACARIIGLTGLVGRDVDTLGFDDCVGKRFDR